MTERKKYKIAVMPGDGIGKDVMDCAMVILKHIDLDAKYFHEDIGLDAKKRNGTALSDHTLRILKACDCCLFGAVSTTDESTILRLRQEFALSTNFRPCKGNGIDIAIFRENTEDLYAQVEYNPIPRRLRNFINKHERMKKFKYTPNEEMAIALRIITVKACTNIVARAFRFAARNNKKKITVVEKANVLKETGSIIIKAVKEISKKYPNIEVEIVNIDNMCMQLVKNPENYEVIVTTNLFGDILSDLCSQLVGGIGYVGSANIGKNFALFEPIHGSAPKYAGQYKANPIGMIRSIVLMLEWLGETKKAKALDLAINEVIEEGKARTFDMGGINNSLEVTEEIAKKYDSHI